MFTAMRDISYFDSISEYLVLVLNCQNSSEMADWDDHYQRRKI